MGSALHHICPHASDIVAQAVLVGHRARLEEHAGPQEEQPRDNAWSDTTPAMFFLESRTGRACSRQCRRRTAARDDALFALALLGSRDLRLSAQGGVHSVAVRETDLEIYPHNTTAVRWGPYRLARHLAGTTRGREHLSTLQRLTRTTAESEPVGAVAEASKLLIGAPLKRVLDVWPGCM